MEVIERFTCECNGNTFPTKASLQAHKLRKVHRQWETENEVFDLRCRCKRLENENETLKYALETLKNIASVKTNDERRSKPSSCRLPRKQQQQTVETPSSVRIDERGVQVSE
jgi:hypothetical protein